jgi:alkylhydroperoxidase/carboxymuconolactone decarboxylase family protein YurZ
MAEKHFIDLMSEEAPAVSKAFFDLAGTLQKEGGLDEKTFQLVYIAIKASIAETGAVAAHAGLAKKAGATREEVLGAVLITLMTNGVHGVGSCFSAAIDGYDNA